MNKIIYKNESVKRKGKDIYYDVMKRIIDISISIFLLIILMPLIILFFILVKLESRGPFIYKQRRVGLKGNIFIIYKIRTMYVNAEINGIKLAEENDSRITNIGKILRRLKIDEVPQLINIIKGDMSIVGPRPERPYFTNKYISEIPNFNKRNCVKPGLTGYAQINGTYYTNPYEKLKMDLFYIERKSVFLDLKIMLKTLKVILKGNGFR